MSWDKCEFDETSKCACGRGRVIKHCWREDDDWGRSRDGVSSYEIECPKCKLKYQVKSITRYRFCPYSWKSSNYYTAEYLVPNDMNLPQPLQKKYIQINCLEEEIASKFTVNELSAVIDDMTANKYSTRVQLDNSKDVIKVFHSRKGRKSISFIIPLLQEIVRKYDTYQWNFDSIAEFRRQEKIKIEEIDKIITETLSNSFELRFTNI